MINEKIDSGQNIRERWTDISVAAQATMIGANQKPDFDFTNIGLLFPQNEASEKIYMCVQMDHRKKLGTGIRLHVHYVQSSANKPIFTAQVRFYNNGASVPSFSTINTSDEGGNTGVFDYTSGSILQIGAFPEITAPVNESLSANFDVILWRSDNIVTGDVLVKYIDSHYQLDDDGSRKEFVK